MSVFTASRVLATQAGQETVRRKETIHDVSISLGDKVVIFFFISRINILFFSLTNLGFISRTHTGVASRINQKLILSINKIWHLRALGKTVRTQKPSDAIVE